MRENCRSFARATINRHTMQLIKKIIIGLIILVIVAAVVSLFFLNEAQRMIVGMAAGLGVINLLGVLYFVQKNADGRSAKPKHYGIAPTDKGQAPDGSSHLRERWESRLGLFRVARIPCRLRERRA